MGIGISLPRKEETEVCFPSDAGKCRTGMSIWETISEETVRRGEDPRLSAVLVWISDLPYTITFPGCN